MSAALRTLAGRRVHPIGLGCMPLSIEGRPDAAAAVRVIHAALDHGIEVLDTADVYALGEDDVGHNEELVGRSVRAWRGDRARIVVATKGGAIRPGGRWEHEGRPEHLVRACEASLRRLGTEIDLYQLHAVDDRVPLEESVGALARLREAGKVRAIGLSNVTREELARALSITVIASVQNRAGFYDRAGLVDGVIDACEASGIAFVAHSPVGGWKAGGIAHEPVLRAIADARAITPHAVVLAWLLARSPALLPIPGASKIENAISSARAADVVLAPDELAALDRQAMLRS